MPTLTHKTWCPALYGQPCDCDATVADDFDDDTFYGDDDYQRESGDFE